MVLGLNHFLPPSIRFLNGLVAKGRDVSVCSIPSCWRLHSRISKSQLLPLCCPCRDCQGLKLWFPRPVRISTPVYPPLCKTTLGYPPLCRTMLGYPPLCRTVLGYPLLCSTLLLEFEVLGAGALRAVRLLSFRHPNPNCLETRTTSLASMQGFGSGRLGKALVLVIFNKHPLGDSDRYPCWKPEALGCLVPV